jgi:hypothetical protein
MSPTAIRTSRLGRQRAFDLRPGGPEGPTPKRRPDRGGACSDDGSLTLEQRISRVWEGLAVAGATESPGAAECPVCESRAMELRGGVGVCRGCGSRLS